MCTAVEYTVLYFTGVPDARVIGPMPCTMLKFMTEMVRAHDAVLCRKQLTLCARTVSEKRRSLSVFSGATFAQRRN